MRTVIALILGVLTSVGAAHAADRFVSSKGNDEAGANTCASAGTPCRSIANALLNADPGDVIKVAKGTYKGSTFITSDGTWTIRGGYGADFNELTRDPVKNKTTVTGTNNTRFLFISSDVGSAITVVLDGLVVSNSKALGGQSGGGVSALAGAGSIHLQINNVVMTGNSVGINGGAIALEVQEGSIIAHITASVFKNNKAGNTGGAIHAGVLGSGHIDFTVLDSRFEGNKAGFGGAIRLGSIGSPGFLAAIVRSVFLKNGGANEGGGGAIEADAQATDGGEAAGSLLITNSVLQESTALSGAAVQAIATAPAAPAAGGTASLALDLRNNTIVANKAAQDFGTAVQIFSFAPTDNPTGSATVTGTLLNNIIWGNKAKRFPSDIEFFGTDNASASFTLITNNIGVLANPDGVSLDQDPDPQLSVDPQLVKDKGIFRLKPGSPMIDVGTCTGAPPDDFEGDPRPDVSGACDIGADEL